MRSAAFLLLALPLCADGLSDLRARLGKFQGQTPVKGQVERQLWQKDQDGKEAPKIFQGAMTFQVEDGPGGLRIQIPQALMSQARKERMASLQDPEKTPPTARVLSSAGPMEVADVLDAAEGLLRDLAQSTLLEEKADAFEGQPAKLLVLKAEPKLDAQARKAMKSMQATVKVWLDAEGLPLAYEKSVAWKASRFFISFEGTQRNLQRFRRLGDRLVAVQKTEENSNRGMGNTNETKKVTKFVPA